MDKIENLNKVHSKVFVGNVPFMCTSDEFKTCFKDITGYIDSQIINAIPVAIMRPFSPGGSRGFMLDAMKTYGADSLTGQLSCLFQGAAETTFYVIALYFGSVNVKETRYTLSIMLLVDLVCVLTAIFVGKLYF